MTGNQARIFFFGFAQNWAHLQKLNTPIVGESAGHINARQALYRNGVLWALGTIKALPDQLNPIFDSLVTAAQTSHEFDGLESVFLSCLNAVAIAGDQARLTAALTLWTQLTNSGASGSDLDSAVFLISGRGHSQLSQQQVYNRSKRAAPT